MGTSQSECSVSSVLSHKLFSLKPFKLSTDSINLKPKSHNLKDVHRKIICPKPRSGHRIVCNGRDVFSFGGYNPSLNPSDEEDMINDGVWRESKPLFKELWKYNISSKTWTKLNVEGMPDILASNSVTLSGQLLIVHGGTGVPFGATCSHELYVCDLRENDKLEFKLVTTTGDCPPPQYGQATVLVNNYLYAIGGTTGYEYTCDVHRLDVRGAIWEAVYICKGADSEPPGRYRHEIAFRNNKIFVLGGGTAIEAFDLQVVYAFNLRTNNWAKIVTRPDNNAIELYPTPRRCHSSVQFKQYAYVIGGYSGRDILEDIWRLNLVSMKWKKLANFSLDRGAYFHSSCITPTGKLITFGGIVPTETSSTRSAKVHSAWLCIPKLKEISWEAVMFYYPDLECLSEKELFSLGLPSEFICRLDTKK